MFSRLLLEKKKQDELLDQIDALKQKVANANEGLAAANRLSEQLEKKTQTIAMLKHEIKLREDLLKKAQNELKDANSSNTVKVDRYLVKNLVVGYVNADQAKKREVLKIIGIHDFIFYKHVLHLRDRQNPQVHFRLFNTYTRFIHFLNIRTVWF